MLHKMCKYKILIFYNIHKICNDNFSRFNVYFCCAFCESMFWSSSEIYGEVKYTNIVMANASFKIAIFYLGINEPGVD